jgi:hypothetical protein
MEIKMPRNLGDFEFDPLALPEPIEEVDKIDPKTELRQPDLSEKIDQLTEIIGRLEKKVEDLTEQLKNPSVPFINPYPLPQLPNQPYYPYQYNWTHLPDIPSTTTPDNIWWTKIMAVGDTTSATPVFQNFVITDDDIGYFNLDAVE